MKLRSGTHIGLLNDSFGNETKNNKAMDHIKNIIFEQLKNLEKNKQNGSGGCGCGSGVAKQGQEAVSTGGYIDSSSSSSSTSSLINSGSTTNLH